MRKPTTRVIAGTLASLIAVAVFTTFAVIVLHAGDEPTLADDAAISAVTDRLGEPRPASSSDIGIAFAESFRSLSDTAAGHGPLDASGLGEVFGELVVAARRHDDDRSRAFVTALVASLLARLDLEASVKRDESAAQILEFAFNDALGTVLDDDAHNACRRAYLDHITRSR